jgi:hypothetical protein
MDLEQLRINFLSYKSLAEIDDGHKFQQDYKLNRFLLKSS